MRRICQCLLLVTLALFWPSAAAAQPPVEGVVIRGAVSAAIGNDISSPAISGAVGYQMNRAFALEIELFGVPAFDPQLPVVLPALYPPPVFDDEEGSLITFTTNVRLEAPTLHPRLLPFVTMGGGFGSRTQSYRIVYPGIPFSILPPLTGLPATVIRPGASYPTNDSRTNALLMVGSGLSVLWTDHLSIDFDARLMKFLGYDGGYLGRIGAGATYRF